MPVYGLLRRSRRRRRAALGAPRQCRWIVRWTRQPVSPSTTSSGSELTPRRDDRQRREHRLEHAEAEALPARRVDEDVRPAKPRRDVRDAPGEDDSARRRAAVPAPRAPRAPARRRARRARALVPRSAPALAPPRRRPSAARAGRPRHDPGVGRDVVGRVLPQARGQRVEAVVDRRRPCRRAGRPARPGTARAPR